MRISDWSSDVCSSDLPHRRGMAETLRKLSTVPPPRRAGWLRLVPAATLALFLGPIGAGLALDRKSGVEGKRVSVRVDLGGRSILKQKTACTSIPCTHSTTTAITHATS